MRTTEDAKRESEKISKALFTLGSFLAWADTEWVSYGGYCSKEAIEALQTILGWDDERMKEFIEVFVKSDEDDPE